MVKALRAALLIAVLQAAGPAGAHDESQEWLDLETEAVAAQQADVEAGLPADADFEQRAAAWRQWLQERENERRREGWGSDDMPEEPLIIPSRRGRGKPAPKHPGHGIRTEIKGDGRQHHVLGLGHPLPMRGARGAPPAKSAPPAKAAPKKKAPPAKKRR